MSRLVLVVIALMALSLYGVNLLNETVVAPAKDAEHAAKLEPKTGVGSGDPLAGAPSPAQSRAGDNLIE